MAKRRAIICDLDGTLCLKGDRDIYDGSKCHLDTVREPIKAMLERYADTHEVIIITGRSNEYADVTLEWLQRNSIPYHKIWMRDQGDKRSDFVVKHELYLDHVHPDYTVDFVLEDRDQVVDMWREIGLLCLQVAPGDF